ncbi:MAG: hypothetical protein Q8O89_06365 [Nanoarchaeota archaeon]|nr:hypothetical protein [Nanoarchaeota archaeon]
MDKKEMLREWVMHFIKQKDADKIVSIDEQGDKITVTLKEGKSYYFIVPELRDEGFLRNLNKEERITIAVFNKKINLEFLIKNWKDFVDFPFLTFHFVNPESKTDLKWIIRPNVHNRITEPKSLKTGLKSMFDMVEEVR